MGVDPFEDFANCVYSGNRVMCTLADTAHLSE